MVCSFTVAALPSELQLKEPARVQANTGANAIVDQSMEVFLVPVSAERYELYCEVPDEPHEEATQPPSGVVRRLVHRFREMIADAERERRHGRPEGTSRGWASTIKARTVRWVAESIAEQRLLWHLRQQDHATLFYPDDMDEAAATGALRSQLKRDFDKHRFWLAIDSVGLLASALVMLVPGPNLLAYYFAFRMVGHFFSLRGARQGLNRMTWRNEPSAPLSELRHALQFGEEVREHRVRDVADRLHLEHLASFFKRASEPTANPS
jgi:hypothetical protein